MTEYERKIYMLGLSVMNRLKREDLWDGDTMLDSIVDDAIDLGLIEVSDKGQFIFQ